jgi:hypothetical protein
VQYAVAVKEVAEQSITVVRGPGDHGESPRHDPPILRPLLRGFQRQGRSEYRALFRSYVAGEFEIACGIQMEGVQPEQAGNASTPAGTVATMVYMGPYDQMKP